MKPLASFSVAGPTTMRSLVGVLASFDLGKVSLPTSVVDCPDLVSVLDPGARDIVNDWEGRMALSVEEHCAANGLKDGPRLYMDPVLGPSRPKYLSFLEALNCRGLPRWTTSPKKSCSCLLC